MNDALTRLSQLLVRGDISTDRSDGSNNADGADSDDSAGSADSADTAESGESGNGDDVYSSNVTSLLREIASINSTYVTSAGALADQLAAATDDLDDRRAAADAAIRSAVAESSLYLLTQLTSITAAVDSNTASIAQLDDEVRRCRDDVNSRDWLSVAQHVNSSVVEYQIRINLLKQRRDELRALLERMRTVLDMFT